MGKTLPALLLLLASITAFSQNVRRFEPLLLEGNLLESVSFLADDMVAGRASGTPGSRLAERYIAGRFKRAGLKPWRGFYTQSFRHGDSLVLRNVVGWIPATEPCDSYIVVGAHYDHLGTINGTIYNGADDNASGVAALIGLADLFGEMHRQGAGPSRNIIFIAFDGKELNMAGSRHFLARCGIHPRKIAAAINIDIIGSGLVPVGSSPDYMIMLGENTLPAKHRGYLTYLSKRVRYKMDVGLDFYGSRDFTRIVFQGGDQRIFSDAGIPAVLFTSGFHHHTYKASDDTGIVDSDLLRKRTILIFNFVNSICQE